MNQVGSYETSFLRFLFPNETLNIHIQWMTKVRENSQKTSIQLHENLTNNTNLLMLSISKLSCKRAGKQLSQLVRKVRSENQEDSIRTRLFAICYLPSLFLANGPAFSTANRSKQTLTSQKKKKKIKKKKKKIKLTLFRKNSNLHIHRRSVHDFSQNLTLLDYKDSSTKIDLEETQSFQSNKNSIQVSYEFDSSVRKVTTLL